MEEFWILVILSLLFISAWGCILLDQLWKIKDILEEGKK